LRQAAFGEGIASGGSDQSGRAPHRRVNPRLCKSSMRGEASRDYSHMGDQVMSNGKDRKKQEKKKPIRTLMEKRADKKAKKDSKSYSLVIK
jgi:hypothetical protein